MPGRGMLAALMLAASAGTAAAQASTPEDLVRWIYESTLARQGGAEAGLRYLTAPGQRQSFLTARLSAFYDANDSYGDDLLMACIDYDPSIPGQDFSEAEIAGSLDIASDGSEEEWRVTASFTTFGTPARVAYVFRPEAGSWKLDDIETNGAALSAIPCSPKAGDAPFLRGTGYCYDTGSSQLVLDIGGRGSGLASLESWQSTGHFCGLRDEVLAPTGTGWVMNSSEFGRVCTVAFDIQPDNGIRLSTSGSCTPYCGAAAEMDGLVFPGSSQRPCVGMPRN
ncbi:hypothetical protein [Poseidonocella sp. HB161398]|uniref:hypothetical protein n=1 Tax=Poseidonocella sp. HB161398 TaxID=2320855 RepID=UPI001109A1BF|nr:hypothetical protein [Poseidonocella sp. HB161398]